jgi:hypothetical protein
MSARPETLFTRAGLRGIAREVQLLSDRIVRVCDELEQESMDTVTCRNASSLRAGLSRLRAFVPKLEAASSDAVVGRDSRPLYLHDNSALVLERALVSHDKRNGAESSGQTAGA